MGNSKEQIIVLFSIFIIPPTIATFLRFWSRRIARKELALNDWLIIPALICCWIAGIGMLLSAVIGNLGEHTVPEIGPDGQPIFTDVFRRYSLSKWFLQVFATFTIGFTKLSLVALYHDIFAVPVFRKITWGVGIIVTIWTIGYSFALMFQCQPPSAFWNYFEWDQPKHCFEQLKFYLSIPITDVITDFMVILLPVPMIWKLHLSSRKKWGLAGIFALGGLVTAIGFVRLAIFYTIDLATLDYIYFEAPTVYWTFLEAAFAIVGACLPVLAPVLQRRKITSSRAYASRGTADYSGYNQSSRGHTLLSDSASDRGLVKPSYAEHKMGSNSNAEHIALGSVPPPQDGIRVERAWESDART